MPWKMLRYRDSLHQDQLELPAAHATVDLPDPLEFLVGMEPMEHLAFVVPLDLVEILPLSFQILAQDTQNSALARLHLDPLETKDHADPMDLPEMPAHLETTDVPDLKDHPDLPASPVSLATPVPRDLLDHLESSDPLPQPLLVVLVPLVAPDPLDLPERVDALETMVAQETLEPRETLDALDSQAALANPAPPEKLEILELLALAITARLLVWPLDIKTIGCPWSEYHEKQKLLSLFPVVASSVVFHLINYIMEKYVVIVPV